MGQLELARELSRVYRDARRGETSAMIHLFGIKHAADLRRAGVSAVVKLSDVPNSYQVEVNKGVNLARYVTVRPEYR